MNNRSIHAATLGLFLGWFCLGCGQSTQEPSPPVPADCQRFLAKFFEALKAKDVGTIQELSSYIPVAQTKQLPQGSVDMMREAKRKFAAQCFERMLKESGDFQSYSVLGVKETTIAANDLPAANVMGAGIHTEIVCKTKFSKKRSASIGFHLLKETQDSEYCILAWKYQAEP